MISRTVALLNQQCAQSKFGFYFRQLHPIPRCDYVLVLDLQWTEAEQKRFLEDGTRPDITRVDVEKDGRSNWFFDITQRWTALPQAKFEVELDEVKIPETMVLIGLEGKETKICFVQMDQVSMKKIGEKEVQFIWREDGRSSLYKPLRDGTDLVEARVAEKMITLQI